jgi:DNA recombination protein RmuC
MDLATIFLLLLNVLILLAVAALWKRRDGSAGDSESLRVRVDALHTRLDHITKDSERLRGELKTEVSEQFGAGLRTLHSSVEEQLVRGREEQSKSLLQATGKLEEKFAQLEKAQQEAARQAREETGQTLGSIRGEIQQRLLEITGQVQEKLDKNIREGFAHFTEVQKHLKSAEEQLRNVGALGDSIQDLNKLLQLPHLRGKFGEESLERLLHDFLPAHLYELQCPLAGGGVVDAAIKFPGRVLPIDAKFPREQVSALFENGAGDLSGRTEARATFERVMKTQAKSIKGYIQPEHGTTEIALMYLPSETLYMEAVRNRTLWEELIQWKVLPVSPNTLLVTLECIHMVHTWYQVQEGLAKSMEEFKKAEKSFTYFESKFTVIGKSLESAQKAFETAQGHLGRYKRRISKLTGEETLELEAGEPEGDESTGAGT